MDAGSTNFLSPWELEQSELPESSVPCGLIMPTNMVTVLSGLLHTIAHEFDLSRMAKLV